MSNITTQAFMDLLGSADAVRIDDGPLLTGWDETAIVGQSDNEIVRFTWTDDEGVRFGETITEGGIESGTFHPEYGKLVCANAEGDPTTISFFSVNSLRTPGSGIKASACFVDELLERHETFTDIAEVYGTRTVIDLLYLQQAIMKGSYVEHFPGESRLLDLIETLPSQTQWRKFIVEQP